MPDLGNYVWEVITAYLCGIALLGGLIGRSLYRAYKARKALENFDKTHNNLQ